MLDTIIAAEVKPLSLSLRVGATYKTATGDIVKIVKCDLNLDDGYYLGDNGLAYYMDGTQRSSQAHLVELVDLNDVQYVQPEVGKSYRTERGDYVTIHHISDQLEDFPFRSSVGDFYNNQGERWRASPGSHLVVQEDRPIRSLNKAA